MIWILGASGYIGEAFVAEAKIKNPRVTRLYPDRRRGRSCGDQSQIA
jgi:putative NADH-flavin reductase